MLRSLQKIRYFMPRRFVSSKVICYEDKSLFPPEEGYVVDSIHPNNMAVPEMRLEEYVWINHKLWPNHLAFICGITGRQYTYAQLRDKSAKLACALHKSLAISPGDVVAICLPNMPEWPIAILGSLEAGAVITSLNPVYTPEEIAYQVSRTSAKVIFSTVDGFPNVQKALQLVQHPIKPIAIKTNQNDSLPSGAIDFHAFVDQQELFSFENPRTCQDLAILPFSSGTTGLPKGVELTHFNIVSNLHMMMEENFLGPAGTRMATADFQESLPGILPYFHIYGLVRALFGQIQKGAKIITQSKFDPGLFLNTLIEHKASALQLVPPIINFLGTFEGATKKHFEHLYSVVSGAAPLKHSDVERFMLKTPKILFAQGHGLSEASPVTLCSLMTSRNYESIGSPLPGTQVKIVPLDGSSLKGLGPGEKGELLARGPQVMRGYLNNPEATKETIVEGNWLRTGDVAYYDESGEFYITDRLKELIKVKGFQVAPAEIEGVLRRHPAIADTAVVGVKDDRSGEVPRAFVVLKKGADGTKPEEIQKFVADKVAEYKQLRGGVVFIEQIPKNNTGKIMRRVLKEKFCQ